MTTLMTYAGPASPYTLVTRTGGVPFAPAGFDWPRCAECAGPMQFQAQVLLDDLGPATGDGGVLSLFMCLNDPGRCPRWEARAGANRALLFPRGGLVLATVPADGETLLPEASAVDYVTVDGAYDDAIETWAAAAARPCQEVLGMLGGTPAWLRDDETPPCLSCGRPMGFVAQLEEGHDPVNGADYGGGCAYAFVCEPCREGAFLWQS